MDFKKIVFFGRCLIFFRGARTNLNFSFPLSVKNKYLEKVKKNGRGGPYFFLSEGVTNERLGTDQVTLGPMRGLEKTAPNVTEPHTDLRTWQLYD